MGYKLVKHLESVNYNRKLFYLDRGAVDLPPITNKSDIMPGSEARSLTTGEKWILNSHYKWVWIGTGEGGLLPDPDAPLPGEEPTINGVTLTPMNITVAPGAEVSFKATIDGDSKLNQGIVWTVKGNKTVKTTISQDGILSIAETEKATSLTVRATSEGDSTKYAQAVVTIDASIEEPLAPIVTGVTLQPANVEIIRGRSFMFSADVQGANISDKSVTFEVSGNTSNMTEISEDGILHVASDELSKVLTVKAISVLDPTKSAMSIVSTIAESEADNPMAIESVTVIPDHIEVGQSYNTQFAAVVRGKANPPEDVVWKIVGSTSAKTRITQNGLLVVSEDEKLGLMTVLAISAFDPDIYGEADVIVVAKDTPGVADPSVTAVVISPDNLEMKENTQQIFSAVVIGNNNPSQAVTWKMYGNKVITSYITDQGVVMIGMGETAEVIQIVATSVQDSTKTATAYISIAKPDLTPFNGIEEIPEAPLNAKYVRERLGNGDAVWTKMEKEDEGPVVPDPEIMSITVDPESATVAPGSVISFVANVYKIGDLNDEVVWSMKGNISPNTSINQEGFLSIAADETSKMITVRATSVVDKTRYGKAIIAVDKDAPLVTVVTSVKVVPPQAQVIRGRQLMMQAIVTGINVDSQDVDWRITGNNNDLTKIDANGLLTIHKSESCNVLVVTATSKVDYSKSGTAVLSIVPEEMVDDPYEITGVTILPFDVRVGQGYSTRVTAIVEGINNPPQDVIWKLLGTSDPATHISREGVIYVGMNEALDDFTVQAASIYAPDKTATAIIDVVAHDTPGVADKVVTSVVVTPEMIESFPGAKITFRAVVLGQNNPSQEVTWTLSGNHSARTVINKFGVLDIGPDELSKVLSIRVTSVENKAISANALVTLTEEQVTPDTGIAEVPELPLATDYVRRRDQTGKAFWAKHVDQGGGRGGYIGTFNTYAEMMQADLAGAAVNDYAIVSHDENNGGLPAIYTVHEGIGGVKQLVFETLLAKRPILGDKLDILNVLDNGVHSKYIKDIEVMADFDLNEERYELFKSPSAWKLVTELHPAFWEEVRKHPDWYKMIVGMSNADGSVHAYLTCFTDDHEFEHHKKQAIHNPEPYPNTLGWTNTVGKGDTFTVSDGHNYRRYEFDRDTMTLSVIYREDLGDATPGVSPWVTVVGEYSLLANGEIIGPLAGVTDPTGYLWVSDHEKFMIGSAGNGTQMFCYRIDTQKSFIFDVPAGAKKDYQMATDVNERYFFMFIDADYGVWGDSTTGETKLIHWDPEGYSGLSTPTPLTRPSISVDGKYYLHTSTNQSTPVFTTFNFANGKILTEAPNKGTSSSAIGMQNNKIFTNTPEGLISLYHLNDNGTLEMLHQETPYAARYVVQYTGVPNQLLLIKVEDKANCPVWFVYDLEQQRIVDESANRNSYCDQTNPQGKGCIYEVSTPAGPRYLLTIHGSSDGLVIEYTNRDWVETQLPFGGLGNNAHQYNQPSLLLNGQILVTQDETGKPVGFDLVNKVEVDLEALEQQQNTHLVQIDDHHLMWCGDKGSQLIRVLPDDSTVEVFRIPENQVLVYGFGDIR